MNLSDILKGNIDDGLVTIYSAAGCGKSTICFQTAIKLAKKGVVYFLDIERSFSIERMVQLGASVDVLKNIRVIVPGSLKQQGEVLNSLKGPIIIDGITSLYKLEYESNPTARIRVNKELSNIMNSIKGKPVLCTAQLFENIKLRKQEIVGGMLVRVNSKYIVKLIKLKNSYKAIMEKPNYKVKIYDIEEIGVTGK